MKHIFIFLFAIVFGYSSFGQSYKSVNLNEFAPYNPTVNYEMYAPIKHKFNGEVKAVLKMNAQGFLTSYKEYNEEGFPIGEQQPSKQISYHYGNGNEVVVEETSHSIVPVSSTLVYTLQDDGKIVGYKRREANPKDEIIEKYIYNEQGLITASIEERHLKDNNSGSYTFRSDTLNYEYDSANRLIKMGSSFTYNYIVNGEELLVEKLMNDRVVERKKFDQYGNNTFYQSYEYEPTTFEIKREVDQFNNIVKSKTITNAGQTSVVGYRLFYKNGKETGPTVIQPDLSGVKELAFGQFFGEFATIIGFVKDGKQNGPGYYFANGTIKIGNFEDGLLSKYGGEKNASNLSVITLGEYDKGVLNGYAFSYDELQDIAIQAGIYKNGKLKKEFKVEGLPTFHKDENGIYRSESTFAFTENGKEVGLRVSATYPAGVTAKYYNDSGEVVFFSGDYEDGVQGIGWQQNNQFHGLAALQTKTGMKCGIFEQGELVTEVPLIQ